MTDATTDTGPIEGLITLEDLRVGLLDGIDVKHVRRPTAWSPPTALASAR